MAINLPNGLLELLGIVPNSETTVTGTNGADSMNGSDANQHFLGLGGGDSINAAGGSDILEGGAGGDSLNGGTGNDYIDGGTGGDSMNGQDGIDTLGYSLSAKAVTITLNSAGGGAGSGAGSDAQGDSFTGFENVVGSAFADKITGNNLTNVLAGLAGNDKLYGMGGNDILIGGAGADLLDGGAGFDTANYSTSASPVHLVLGGVSSGGDAAGDTFISIENFVGTSGADVFDGSASLTGFSADGRGGGETMIGGHGDDQLSIGGAAALATGFAALQTGHDAAIQGHEGNDDLHGGAGNDDIDGGEGDDNIDGGDGDDTEYGGDGNDVMFGGGGNDTLVGGPGNNTVHGDGGDDTIFVGPDSSQMFGDGGNDTFVFTDETFANASTDPENPTDFGMIDLGDDADVVDISSSTSGVTMTLSDPVPAAFAMITEANQFFDASLTYSGDQDQVMRGLMADHNPLVDEKIVLTAQGDVFHRNSSNNIVNGGGNDTLNGGVGNDNLDSGAGDDFIAGGLGSDTLTGGAGADKFRYFEGDLNPAEADAITDFENGDLIDLSAIDADSEMDGDQAFTVEQIQFDGEQRLVTINTPTGPGYIYLTNGFVRGKQTSFFSCSGLKRGHDLPRLSHMHWGERQ